MRELIVVLLATMALWQTMNVSNDTTVVDLRADLGYVPDTNLVLEIGGVGYRVGEGHGIAGRRVNGRLTIRVVDASTCEVLTSFEASRGSSWVMRLSADSQVPEVNQDEVNEAGPGILAGPPTNCP
jgi:hypothetical protein